MRANLSDNQATKSTGRAYPRAPIVEAIIDVRFATPLDMEICDRVRAKLKSKYPISNDWEENAILVNAATKAAQFEETVRGYRLSTPDQTEIVIAANTRFSTSRLAPYNGWEEFRGDALRNWMTLKSVTGFRKLARIGVRYINRIDIPFTGQPVQLSDYLKFYIEVPQPPFPPIGEQAIQAVFPFDDFIAVVNTGSVPSPLVNHFAIALDIDFGRDRDVPQSDDEMWEYIEKLRDEKNVLFEACLTDRARALFE